MWSYNQLLNKTPTQKSRFVLVIQVREFKKRMKNHIQIYMNLNCTFTFIENIYAFPPEDETTFD